MLESPIRVSCPIFWMGLLHEAEKGRMLARMPWSSSFSSLVSVMLPDPDKRLPSAVTNRRAATIVRDCMSELADLAARRRDNARGQ